MKAHLPVRKSGSGVGSEISSRHWFSSGTVATTRPSGSCWSKPRAKLFCLETEQTFIFCLSTVLFSMQSIFQHSVKHLCGPKVMPHLETHLVHMTWVSHVNKGGKGGIEMRDESAEEVYGQGRECFPPPQVSPLTPSLQDANALSYICRMQRILWLSQDQFWYHTYCPGKPIPLLKMENTCQVSCPWQKRELNTRTTLKICLQFVPTSID